MPCSLAESLMTEVWVLSQCTENPLRQTLCHLEASQFNMLGDADQNSKISRWCCALIGMERGVSKYPIPDVSQPDITERLKEEGRPANRPKRHRVLVIRLTFICNEDHPLEPPWLRNVPEGKTCSENRAQYREKTLVPPGQENRSDPTDNNILTCASPDRASSRYWFLASTLRSLAESRSTETSEQNALRNFA